MRFSGNAILCFMLLCAGLQSFAQRGKEGDYTVGTTDEILNTYTFMTVNAVSGQQFIVVDDEAMLGGAFSGPVAEGDLLLIIQLQGATVDINEYATTGFGGNYTAQESFYTNGFITIPSEFGRVTNYGNAGKFEKVEVSGNTSPNVIPISCGLRNNYDVGFKVQVVRIPRFENLTVPNATSITSPDWNGQIGGIVALEVNSILDLNSGGVVSAAERGFRGGEVDPNSNSATADCCSMRYLGSFDPMEGAEKGESIFGYHVELDNKYSRYGIGGVANGGGGGGYENCGGGGGSNIGALGYTGLGNPSGYTAIWDLESPGFGSSTSPGGGRGGYALAINNANELTDGPGNSSWGSDWRKSNGGFGGHPLMYDNTRIFFGGGGGAGDANSINGGVIQGGSGGRGGGLVYIVNYGSLIGDGTISVDGENGEKTNPTDIVVNPFSTDRTGNDGAGGGGAGGWIHIENATSIPNTIVLSAEGGDGGNQDIAYGNFASFEEASGPGGSGAGGAISYTLGAPIENVNGGVAGVTNSSLVTNFPPNGATEGAPGVAGLTTDFFDIIATDTTICGSQSINLEILVNGVLPAGYTIGWYTDQYGGALFETGLTYSTSVLTADTTLWIGTCPGTFRVPLNVFITTLDDATFTSGDYCESTTNTIGGIVTPGGTFTIQSQTGSGAATIDGLTGIISNAVSGDQITIEYATPAGSCQNSSTVVVNVTPADDATFVTGDYCETTTNTVGGIVTPGGTFSIQSQTGSGLATIDGATGVVSNAVAGDQITIEYLTPAGPCQGSSTVIVNVTPADDPAFTTGDFCEGTSNTVSSIATPGGTFSIQSQTGSGLATIDGASGVISNAVAGDQITIQYDTPAGPCQGTSTVVVNVTPLDDATFTSGDFCDGTSNTIGGIVTTGGTFTIQSQTGSGLATIDGASGVISNAVAGDQVVIEYTTPAGACQNSSTVTVNVTPLDDATFTSGDYCEGTSNTVGGIVTPGGTFSIQSQTGSGLATIDGASGIISNAVGGDQVVIEYTTPAGGCQNSSTVTVNVTPLDDATFTSGDYCEGAANTIGGVVTPGGTFTIQSQTGSGSATIDGLSGVISNAIGGDQVVIEYTTPAGGCQNSLTVTVNVTPLDDATFTSGDYCESTTNTIGGVVTPGGTFTIQSQTGSGLATIDGASGIVSNAVAGDQVVIEYTTPAGGCQNSSTVTVNVTSLDDATFTSGDYCESTTNTIGGIVTPGGTFTIQSQTGSGLATIDGATGVVSNAVAGDQVVIEYTTPAGGCQNSSTVTVNVTSLDDATFNSSDYCEGTANTVGGVVTPGGTFTIQSQTGSGLATIDGATGVISNAVGGDQVVIQYTTPAGGCQNSSTVTVNVTPLDDATFTSGDYCEGTANTVGGVVTPGGTFTIQSQTGSGLATIDATSGVVSNAIGGDQVVIEYTTPAGGCQNSSTVTVNVTPLDDATFTSGDFCEGTANTIGGIVTPGGTFAIQSQTGSGLATIDGASGVISNAIGGDQVVIEYTTPAAGCQNSSTVTVNVTPLDDATFTSGNYCESGSNTIGGVVTPGGTFTIQSQTGSGLATIDGASGVISNAVAGDQVVIEYTTPAGGCQNSSTVTVNVTSIDDASFTTADFCEGTTNTVGGIVTPGGTFTIQSQTGSGLATIDGASGVVSNAVAGDQVVIEYTTPAGGCQNSSTITVNVIPLDDATFTSADFCEGTANTIGGVVTPGGTFAIQSQTGSGSATIDGASGVISNAVGGDQVVIEYTTPAAGCQNTSTVTVNVTPLNDATFTSGDYCEGTANTVGGIATPGGAFSIQSQTGSGLATIDGASGVISSAVGGDQVVIEYTTPAGGCQNSSTVTVNVTALDDASFTLTPTCEGGTAAVSGLAGGTFSFNTAPGDAAVIDATTGTVSNGTPGATYDVLYTTNGSCPNSSNQTVTASTSDDPSFTLTATCDGATASITGTTGGIFTFNTTPSDAATIDPATGTITGSTGGVIYDVEYATSGACADSSTQTVTSLVQDDASFTLTPTCDGATANVSGTSGGTFSLGFLPGFTPTIDPASGTVTGADSGVTIPVIYITSGACPDTLEVSVDVLQSDDASFTLVPTCEGATVGSVATTGGLFDFDVLPIDAASIDNVTGEIVGGDGNTAYFVSYTTNGVCPDSTVQSVTSSDCSTDVEVSTAFTPNNDLNNDTWEIRDLDSNYPENIVRVYNRWGNTLFEHVSTPTNPYDQNRWDGTYNGDALPVGSYYYVIDSNDDSGEVFTGSVSILVE